MISETDMLARFEKVKRLKDDDWLVTCPAHDDNTPSLHVTRADDRWLLHCLGNCDKADVLAAARLTPADLFDTTNGNGRHELEAYTYVDQSGTALFEVVRFEPKDFRQRRPDGSGGIQGVRRVIYRLPAIIDAVANARRVWIVEGERDVHALERAGQVATCNPGGAGKWRDEYSEAACGRSRRDRRRQR